MAGRLLNSRGFGIAVVAAVIVMILAGAALIQYSIDKSRIARADWRKSSPYDNMRSVLDVLGGVREALAAFLWIRADTLFHEYVGGDPLKDKPLYSYFWLVTRLDPYFTMAYYYASWMLCGLGHTKEGFELALEGVRNNPYSAILQENLAEIFLFYKRNPEKARYHCARAIELSKDKKATAIYRVFLKLIDEIRAGKKQMPPLATLEVRKKIRQQAQEHEHEH